MLGPLTRRTRCVTARRPSSAATANTREMEMAEVFLAVWFFCSVLSVFFAGQNSGDILGSFVTYLTSFVGLFVATYLILSLA